VSDDPPRSELYDDEEIRPWYEHARSLIPGAELLDVHGHTGFNDPDGFQFSGEQLQSALMAAGARGVVISLHEPGGYAEANDRVMAEAQDSGGRLVAFCRLDPKADPVAEAERCLDSCAQGIKLHPRAEGFELSDPEVEPIFALAHERQLPILIHAGRGIRTLAHDAVVLIRRYPEARVILAHAAICDLSWLWREAPRYPNLFFDAAWWQPEDLAALFSLIPPGQILFGSDLPYFTPFMSAAITIRFGLQVGLSAHQLEGILGLQTERLLQRQSPLDLGEAPGPGRLVHSILLSRLTSTLTLAIGRMLMGRTGYEPLALARLACDLGEASSREAHVARNVLALLHRQERFAKENPRNGPPLGSGIRSVMLAACISRTPDVPLPDVPDLDDYVDLQAAAKSGHRYFHETGLESVDPPPRDLRRSSAADHTLLDHRGAGQPVVTGAAKATPERAGAHARRS
jgi:predicted TIM-barrel fold metal-dependent hydrolase